MANTVHDYDAATNEYVNGHGERYYIPGMDDDHLTNTIAYLERRGRFDSTALYALKVEQAKRRGPGQSSLYQFPTLSGTALPSIFSPLAPFDQSTTKGTDNNMSKQLGQLFEVAILQDDENTDTGHILTNLVYGPKALVAKDADKAKTMAIADLARESVGIDTDNLRVLVRAFAGC